ncbi:hypothetical protein [Cylindrospermopsis raciborskii]|nr:hypothetical protein [Cylindrospermopsis raciborskii]MCZ2207928.1 hypothetical protein [Cylindrospermopsis raciborskii PAMP2011]
MNGNIRRQGINSSKICYFVRSHSLGTLIEWKPIINIFHSLETPIESK